LKKVLLIVVAILAISAVSANAEMTKVEDPTPDGTFSGTYVVSNDDPNTPDQNEYQEGTQTGYVGVDAEGQYVVACNGNPEITRPDDGSPLVGYVWVGPNGAASNPTAQSPAGVVGAGNNHEDAEGNPTGESPCP
jgi:hypothetical protein